MGSMLDLVLGGVLEASWSDLGRPLGAILDGFWVAKMRPTRPKMAPRRSEMPPRCLQDGPRWLQDAMKTRADV